MTLCAFCFNILLLAYQSSLENRFFFLDQIEIIYSYATSKSPFCLYIKRIGTFSIIEICCNPPNRGLFTTNPTFQMRYGVKYLNRNQKCLKSKRKIPTKSVLLTLFLSGSGVTLSVRAGPLWPRAIFSIINDLKNH